MNRVSARWSLPVMACALALSPAPAGAKAAVHWVEAFGASPADYVLWPDAPAQMKALAKPRTVSGTVRTSFVISAGGDQVRIRFSNEAGSEPLPIEAASVGLADPRTGEPGGPLLPVRFGGKAGIVIPAGAPALSDPVPLRTRPLDRLVVSLFTPGPAQFVSLGGSRMMLAAGDQTLAPRLENAGPLFGRLPVSGAAVSAPRQVPVIVTFGDSLTDGSRPTPIADAGYPQTLARRLAALPAKDRRAVVNAGIAGNRLLVASSGISALARLDRDALRIPGLSHILLLEGINDIGRSGGTSEAPAPVIKADQVIAAYQQIIARAHAAGVKVIGATLMPIAGSNYGTPEKDAVRKEVNAWVRTARAFDGVVDFESAVRDPAAPDRLRKDFDSGDHLHPNSAGYAAMGEAIDLNLFR